MTTSTSANPANNNASISSSNPVLQCVSQSSFSTGTASSSSSVVNLNQDPETSCDPTVPFRLRNKTPLPDPRTKKDAMTNTTSDYKLIPVEEHNISHRQQVAVSKSAEHQPPSPNVIMDSYYPSLEESLVTDKVDRKPSRCNNSSVHNTSSRLSGEETPSPTVAPFSVGASNPKNCAEGPRHLDVCGEVSVHQQSIEVSVIVPRSGLCSVGETVVPEVSVASASCVMPSNTNRAKETVFRAKTCGRKVSAAGSIVASSSSVRPPVIIMDEQEQEAAFRDNVGTLSELTFGFEVNEQLLLSDAEENSRCGSTEPLSNTEELLVSTSPATGSTSSDMLLPDEVTGVVPALTSRASEDFSARYREPLTQQADNHDLIVTFVGLGK